MEPSTAADPLQYQVFGHARNRVGSCPKASSDFEHVGTICSYPHLESTTALRRIWLAPPLIGGSLLYLCPDPQFLNFPGSQLRIIIVAIKSRTISAVVGYAHPNDIATKIVMTWRDSNVVLIAASVAGRVQLSVILQPCP